MEACKVHREVSRHKRRLLEEERERAFIRRQKRRVEQLQVLLAQKPRLLILTGNVGGGTTTTTTTTEGKTEMTTTTAISSTQPLISSSTHYNEDLEEKKMTRKRTELVPIRLDIDTDGYKLRDTFMWNLHETQLTPEAFAEITCKDFDLPVTLFIPLIARSIREQLHEYAEAQSFLRDNGPDLKGLRASLRLDVTIGLLQLRDRIEWDLGEGRNRVDEFAQKCVKELALPEEFVTAIANDLAEQLVQIRRAISLVGFQREEKRSGNGAIAANPSNVRLNDPELQSLLLPTLPCGHARRDPNQLDEFTPIITELDPVEVEKIELCRDREVRRRRRQVRTRKGPIALTSGMAGGNAPATGVSGPSGITETHGIATNTITNISITTMANWTTFSPPKTMRTPLSYRGSLHRLTGRFDDDDSSTTADGSSFTPSTGRSTRSRRSRK